MNCSYHRLLSIIRHPEVWEGICDDATADMPPEQVAANLLQSATVLSPNEHCAWIVIAKSAYWYEIHTCILPAGRGRAAITAARDAMLWLFSRTTAQKITSFIPVENKKAQVFARLCGWQKEGLVRASHMRSGRMRDQVLVGITKEEFICQQ